MQFSERYLRSAADRDEVKQVKELSYDLMELREGSTALDIGCGPGIDTIPMAQIVGRKGSIVGLDPNPDFIRSADASAMEAGVSGYVEHRLGSGANIPFESETFDSVRCERVLQHLNPAIANSLVREALRVVKERGHCVFVDTDWASLSINHEDIALERLLIAWRIVSWTNGFAARAMGDQIGLAGGITSTLRVVPIPLALPELLLFIEPILQRAITLRWLPASRGIAWLSALQRRSEDKAFYAFVNMVLCSAKRSKAGA